MGDSIADEVKVLGFALNDAAQTNYRIDILILGKPLSGKRKFERARDIFANNVFFFCTVRPATSSTAPENRDSVTCFVPFRHDDPKLLV